MAWSTDLPGRLSLVEDGTIWWLAPERTYARHKHLSTRSPRCVLAPRVRLRHQHQCCNPHLEQAHKKGTEQALREDWEYVSNKRETFLGARGHWLAKSLIIFFFQT
eukprot:278629-Pelagomonas_calceolata.AAC.3